MAFDRHKPTVQLLGRWQPWHAGHTALFKRAVAKTGQVIIMIRSMEIDKNNPFAGGQVAETIQSHLEDEGFTLGEEYTIIGVPNITDISYGRDVGYTISEESFSSDVEMISATEIRKQMNASQP